MSPHPAVTLGGAAAQLADHGAGRPLTLDQAIERTAHLATMHTKAELAAAMAYLGCQIVGYRNRADLKAELALSQIATVIRQHEERAK